ncbi:4-(cytidine 5'-diphospho)-2-C-methyl-D-erythritol kinase [Vibrio sp. WJH972]
MQSSTTQWPSPAKLNLFLYITAQRDDGYHELQTLFQFLDYSDQLFITPTQRNEVTITPELEGVATQDNLIWRAAMALKEKTGCSLGANINIEKKLPMGGGIGGGSSNAATTLVALNHLWQTNLNDEELAKIGLTLGADVPIFIHGNAAFAEGVGEKLSFITPEEPWYLVIRPNVSISTAEIFSHPQLTRNTPKRELAELLNTPYENDCEKIVQLLYPEVDKQLSWLLQYGPSRLTGTGSCIFAEFDSQEKANNILAKLPDGVTAFVAQGRNTSPLKKTLVTQ